MFAIQDMIPTFELFQPTSVDGASEILNEYGDDAWTLADKQGSQPDGYWSLSPAYDKGLNG